MIAILDIFGDTSDSHDIFTTMENTRMHISDERQLTIMRTQLDNFDGIMEKLACMITFFDPDPEFTETNRNIIRGELSELAVQMSRQGSK